MKSKQMTRNYENFLIFNSNFYKIEINALKFVIVVLFYKKKLKFSFKILKFKRNL